MVAVEQLYFPSQTVFR